MTVDAVLGIDIGGTKVSLACVGLDGRALDVRRWETPAGSAAGDVMARVLEAAGSMSVGVRVVGVGVATPGVVEPDGIRLAPNNPGWADLALVKTIRSGLGVESVVADNDAKVATAAEARWGGLRGVDDGLLLNLGTGISAGAVVGGRLVRGAHGAALEIAYQLPSDDHVHGVRDGRAPLEETLSGNGLRDSATTLLGHDVSTAEVFAAMTDPARDDRTRALGELGRAALHTGMRAVANLAVALDPEVLLVSGGMLRSAEVVLPALAEALERAVPFPPRVELAHFQEQAPLAGAVLAGFEVAGLAVPDELDLTSTG